MRRTYGSLLFLMIMRQRIKIRCYNIKRGYASFCNATRAIGSIRFITPGFNPVGYRQRSDQSHRLDPFCATGQAAAPPIVNNYIKQSSNQYTSVYMYQYGCKHLCFSPDKDKPVIQIRSKIDINKI